MEKPEIELPEPVGKAVSSPTKQVFISREKISVWPTTPNRDFANETANEDQTAMH